MSLSAERLAGHANVPMADRIIFEDDTYRHERVDVPSSAFLDAIIAADETRRMEASTAAANLRREINGLAAIANSNKKDAIAGRIEWRKRQERKADEKDWHDTYGANSERARQERLDRKTRRKGSRRRVCGICGDPSCPLGYDDSEDE